MDSPSAVTALLTNPSNFLKYYPVKCAGSSAPIQNAVNTTAYQMVKRNAANGNTKEGHTGATRPGVFGFGSRDISSFKLERANGAAGAGSIPVAHLVPMVNYSTNIYGCLDLLGVTTAMPHYVLDNTGSGLMVTGELSNCCFAWIQQGNDLWCIHVQPVGGITPVALHNRLAVGATGAFGAAPGVALSTFGRNDYPGGRASVFGVREGGIWNLYAQLSNDSFNTLAQTYRIHPGGMVRL